MPSTRRRITGWVLAGLSVLAAALCAPAVAAAASPTVAYWGSLSDFPGVLNNTAVSPTPVKMPGPVAQVASSNSAEYALLTDGRVYAFGMNNHGQLGNGTTEDSFDEPVQVDFPDGVKIASLPINVMPIDTGLALDTNGHVWGWGRNGGGELCLGDRGQHLVPVELPFTDVTAAAGAFQHAVYLAGGQVWACGLGELGELGNGTFGSSFTPVKVEGLDPSAHVVTLVAAFANAGALLADGSYLNWGVNGLGQLGIGSPIRRSAVPVKVPLPGPVAQVTQGGSAPGNGQTLVLLENGALYAWGANSVGQLGDGTRTPKFLPERITPPPGVSYNMLASSGSTSYGVTEDGDVYAWGRGKEGEIGDGTTDNSFAPVKVASGATSISGTAYNVLIAIGETAITGGELTQLAGSAGCLVGTAKPGCQHVRALRGPGPLLGSHAVAVSPDGRNVYVASRRSQAIAVFQRDEATGALTQASGTAGCVEARGGEGCGSAVGLDGPNSVAVSPDGQNVYATSAEGSSLAVFARDQTTGALTQLTGSAGCIAASSPCTSARALRGPDVVAVSPDGRNVYVAAFFGDAVVAFSRDQSSGALTQLSGASGCVAAAIAGCAPGFALKNPEGLAVSDDGQNVYVAAPLSSAADVFTRDPDTGALTQTGCLTSTPQSGCETARGLRLADAVAISPDDRSAYFVGGGIANLARAADGGLTQADGLAGCVLPNGVAGCAMAKPWFDFEGVTVSPDGTNVYAMMYAGNALDVFDRDASTGGLTQKPSPAGCFASPARGGCMRARGGLRGASSAALSPDGNYLYVAANLSNSLTVFAVSPGE